MNNLFIVCKSKISRPEIMIRQTGFLNWLKSSYYMSNQTSGGSPGVDSAAFSAQTLHALCSSD